MCLIRFAHGTNRAPCWPIFNCHPPLLASAHPHLVAPPALQTLQHHVGSPSWNHKLVSVKPKLESVPEGGPSTGGPLNLMPLGGGPSGGGSGRVQGMGGGPALQLPPLSGHHHHGPMQHGQHTINGVTSMPPAGAGDYVDLDSPAPGGMRGSLPSAGTLAAQLQMTHVRSETHLPLPEPPHPAANGFLQGTTAAAVDAFRRSLVSLEGPGGMQGAPGGPNMPPPFQPGQGGGPADHLANGHASRHGHMGPPPMGSTAVQGHQPGAAGPSGAQGAPEMVPTAVARRAPSGLPLRKSQSAVELGSWRGGFGAAEEFWADMGLGPTDAKVRVEDGGVQVVSTGQRLPRWPGPLVVGRLLRGMDARGWGRLGPRHWGWGCCALARVSLAMAGQGERRWRSSS